MLVLSRAVGEKVLIRVPTQGDQAIEVELTVAMFSGQKVRLAFNAPNCVTISRSELVHESEEHRREREQLKNG